MAKCSKNNIGQSEYKYITSFMKYEQLHKVIFGACAKDNKYFFTWFNSNIYGAIYKKIQLNIMNIQKDIGDRMH